MRFANIRWRKVIRVKQPRVQGMVPATQGGGLASHKVPVRTTYMSGCISSPGTRYIQYTYMLNTFPRAQQGRNSTVQHHLAQMYQAASPSVTDPRGLSSHVHSNPRPLTSGENPRSSNPHKVGDRKVKSQHWPLRFHRALERMEALWKASLAPNFS